MREPLVQIIETKELEPKVPITCVVLPQDLQGAYRNLLLRYQDHFHDLLVLTGPKGQSGSVRLITHAITIPNHDQGAAFSNVGMASSEANQMLSAQGISESVYGIGAVVFSESDVKTALSIGNMSVCLAGGVELPAGRPQTIEFFQAANIYVLGKNKETTQLTPQAVHFLK